MHSRQPNEQRRLCIGHRERIRFRLRQLHVVLPNSREGGTNTGAPAIAFLSTMVMSGLETKTTTKTNNSSILDNTR